MERKKYIFHKEPDVWIEEREPLIYSKGADGIVVRDGSLLGSGFAVYGQGITLPCEIDGLPVTELSGCFESRELDYIEAYGLKRAFLKIVSPKKKPADLQKRSQEDNAIQLLVSAFMGGMDGGSDEIRCHCPEICGSSESMEYMELVFEAGVMHLDSFKGCRYLYKLSFLGKVQDDADWEYGSFREGVFQDCCNLQEIRGSLHGFATTGSTFEGCVNLRQAPELKLERLGRRDFYNCVRLPAIHLSNGLKYIGTETFAQCISLKDIYIPDTVTDFGTYVFRDCKGLEQIHLPENLHCINSGLFCGCSSLKKAYLADSIESIEDEAFMGCSSLKTPWIPQNLRKIGNRAFMGCSSIGRIFIPDTVEEIGEQAFGNCPQLVIVCQQDSAAYRYAVSNKIVFEVTV